VRDGVYLNGKTIQNIAFIKISEKRKNKLTYLPLLLCNKNIRPITPTIGRAIVGNSGTSCRFLIYTNRSEDAP
jgi:hypothetical protein